mgnify:CR=1 FL=1|tara:strand:- start:719 stop:979 length:261 start_codon:yes stop_codon:yes gene_type:complete
MTLNKEDLKNKIIYRSSYRGTKEMDLLVLSFVQNIIDKLDYDELLILDGCINLDDENLLKIINKIKYLGLQNKNIIKFMNDSLIKK